VTARSAASQFFVSRPPPGAVLGDEPFHVVAPARLTDNRQRLGACARAPSATRNKDDHVAVAFAVAFGDSACISPMALGAKTARADGVHGLRVLLILRHAGR
jgi:hypothetical protein